MNMEDLEDELSFAEQKILIRLSFLKAFSNGLVPDLSVEMEIERRAELKREKAEAQVRIDELERLLREMREN